MYDAETQGYCGVYHGNICRKHIDTIRSVWYNKSGGLENEEITTGLWEELIVTLQEPCRSAADKLLCVFAFPECTTDNKPLPLCYEDCIAVKELFCYKEWAHIEDKKAQGIFIKARGYFRLPDCSVLPKYSNNSASCSYAGLIEMKEDEITYDCVKGRGRFYQDIFPELKNSENFCRNAGGEEKRPWCFTTNSMMRWQHCDIPRCLNSTAEDVETTSIAMDQFLSPTFLIIMSGIGLLAIVVCLLLILLCHRIHKRHLLGYNAPETTEINIDLDKLPSNVAYHRHGATLNPKLEKLEFPRNDIIYIRDLGQGAFGSVFQAKAPGLISDEDFTIVAVKMLKDDASDDMQDDFEKEACLLAEFDHPNIVKLLGVCAVGRPMCLLFEYMGKGDLNEFLRACSPSNYVVRSVVDGEFINKDMYKDNQLGHLDKINIALQIASGMVYLADRKFVHRDLATRNCLISDDMVVKIADFGLSQKIYLQDYYKGSDEMPFQCDVWAFGVCLWEIFSFALQPYYGMTHEEVIKYLKEGNVLLSPDNCPAPVYLVMKHCWGQKPVDRPSFRNIHQTLTDIRDKRYGVRHLGKLNRQFYCTAPFKITQKVGFIGDGSMAKAICRSIKRKGLVDYSQVYVSSPYIKNLDSWKDLGANVSTDNSIVAKEADIIFLAVKPHILQEALSQIMASPNATKIKNKLFISILAGITIADLEKMLLSKFEGSRVVRVMPNTPMLIGEGCTVYTPGTTVTDEDKKIVKNILEETGMCQLLPEHMINAVGAVSASGPAFVYVFIEALSDGGVRMGLHRDMATTFAAQTVMGAAKMVLQTNKHMGTLKDEVCSAGGQTIAGIHALERGRVRGSIMDAVEAAALKAAELGEQSKCKK
ncbi:hypothetical protein NQ317_007486 [Molorchus minor]|uniref:Pyrroline-5-carboxylate reductase n=1 Tax=Molorchus minor TaxID=1323400 RepID=A0ABQ9K278_9CUCU|nr:hypothetical protein NQ317_007486 [Molorchus minor]